MNLGNGALKRWALRLSSPWLALTLLGLVFVHQAVGSAGFLLRQSFELSEMAWFNGPLSIALWSLLCVCQMLASAVRIPLCWSRAGAHLTHLSVVLLTASTIVYFAGKVEGEALLLRSYIEVRTASGSVKLLPDPGAKVQLGETTASVDMLMPRWTVRTGESADEQPQQVWAAMVKITFKDAAPFTATLLEGHPELTQYTMEGRTPKSWLPAFSNVVAHDNTIHVVTANGDVILQTPIAVGAKSRADGRALEITGITPDWPLLAEGFTGRKGTLVAWTLRDASAVGGGMESGNSIIGEPTLTRFMQARVRSVPDARLLGIALVPAPTAVAYRVDRPALWVRPAGSDSASPLRSAGTPLPINGLPRYHDRGTHVGEAKSLWQLVLRAVMPWTHVGEAPLAIPLGELNGIRYAVTGYAPYSNLETVLSDDPRAAVNPTLELAVTSNDSGQHFTIPLRVNSSVEALDDTPLLWLKATDAATVTTITKRLQERFPAVTAEQQTLNDEEAAQTRLVVVESPDKQLTLWLGEHGRTLVSKPLTLGTPVQLRWSNDQLQIEARRILERPLSATMPVAVPTTERRSRSAVGDFKSFIQVTASTAADPAGISTWLPYTPFPQLPPLTSDGTLGSLAPRPITLAIPGAESVELEFSREPFALPGDVWMTGFRVPRRPGSADPAEFYCDVAYADRDGASAVKTGTLHMNNPLPWNGWFLFQSQWDPPYEALSVVGVGNRPAGLWMLASAILLAIGMAWSGIAAANRRSTP